MKGIRTLLPMGLLALALILPSAAVADEVSECKLDAKEEKKACQLVCKEEARMAKDLCRNVDHECAETCRDARTLCLDGTVEAPGPRARREACRATCKDIKQIAKDDCRAQFATGTLELHECFAAANLANYLCKQPCRLDVKDEIKACRNINKTCIKACPPAIVE